MTTIVNINQESPCKDQFEALREQMKERLDKSLGQLCEITYNGKVAYVYPTSPLMFVTFGSGFIVKDRDCLGEAVFNRPEIEPETFMKGYMIDWKVFEEDFQGYDFLMDVDGNVVELSCDIEDEDGDDEECTLGGVETMVTIISLSELKAITEYAEAHGMCNMGGDKLVKLRVQQSGIGSSYEVAFPHSDDFKDVTNYENF